MARKEKFNVGANIDWGKEMNQSPKENDDLSALGDSKKEVPAHDVKSQETHLNTLSDKAEILVSEKENPLVCEKTKVSPATASFTVQKKIKETRSVHKSFLITPTLDKKLQKLSTEMNVSQNDLLNDILTQVFNSIEL